MTRAPWASLALLLTSLTLAACGGGDDESPATTATERSTAGTAPAGASRGKEGNDSASAAADPAADGTGGGDSGSGPNRADRPASLATDPGSIRGARVTATGAVQTLPPSEAGRAEAMENSYASIRAFGEESEGEEATDITFALVQYLDAKAHGDWATACARLYSVLRENLEKSAAGRDCPEVYGTLMSRVPADSRAAAAEIDVASVRRGEGNRAFVIYKTPDTLSADMPMYLDGGVWTVGAVEAYALTPEQLRADG